MRIVEKPISATSQKMIDAGEATVMGLHHALPMTYKHFLRTGAQPSHSRDEHTVSGGTGGVKG